MSAEAWLGSFEELFDSAGFRIAEAGTVATYLRRYGAQAGSFVEGRRKGDAELVIVDLLTGAPQRPVYPIRPQERIGILFFGADQQPFVTMLRDDFPDTEHQQLVPEGFPKAICFDDRPWAEARLTWTPAELIERILSWFYRAARGELHDARQPLDPVLMGSALSFFVSRTAIDGGPSQDLIAEHDPENGAILRVKRAEPGTYPAATFEPFAILSYRVAPEAMKRLESAPRNLASLAAMLDDRGIKLVDDLAERLGNWIDQGLQAAWRLNSRFCVLVEMPIVSPRGIQQDGADQRAFITDRTPGDIAVALGIALCSQEAGKVGFVRHIGKATPDVDVLARIIVQSAEVHLDFDGELAARLAGRATIDERKVVLAGAGAIGSHVADHLGREGRFSWSIVDDDKLLPHNLARHVARGDRVTKPKAALLAEHLNLTRAGPPCATGLIANVMDEGPAGAAAQEALAEADIIIDATASIVAARYLSDHGTSARRASVFFNPAGEAAVLLAEPAGRDITLRDLEAQYLGLVLRREHLASHLGKEPVTVAYTGACRAITNRIPQARAAILSGLASSALGKALDGDEAAIGIWSLGSEGSVSFDAAPPEPVARFSALGWEIAMDAGLVRRICEMRQARVPCETGGVLFGLADIPARRIHLVDASSAPPDSIEHVGSFVRGMVGVEELMDGVRQRGGGQVRYVGEWHSHPPRMSARPSAVDGRQIDWLAALLGMDAMPALMVIAAESEVRVIFADEDARRLPRLRLSAA